MSETAREADRTPKLAVATPATSASDIAGVMCRVQGQARLSRAERDTLVLDLSRYADPVLANRARLFEHIAGGEDRTRARRARRGLRLVRGGRRP
jgi:hypothetical protein